MTSLTDGTSRSMCSLSFVIYQGAFDMPPIALTLMVRLPENFIIVSPIMAPRPQNPPPFESLYIYMGMLGGMYRNFVGALQAATFNGLQ